MHMLEVNTNKYSKYFKTLFYFRSVPHYKVNSQMQLEYHTSAKVII